MMKHIFVDADIILDLIKLRNPFYLAAEKLFTLGDKKSLNLYTSTLIIANLNYILSKTEGKEKSKNIIRELRVILTILPVQVKNIDEALNSNFSDFEDAIEYSVATEHNLECITTRNINDYKYAAIPVMTAESFLLGQGY